MASSAESSAGVSAAGEAAPIKRENRDRLSHVQHLMAGGIAGSVARTLTSPLDVVKINFQVQQTPIKAGTSGRFTGFFNAFAVIYREEGITAFWKGNGSAIIRLLPYAAIKFAAYEEIKRQRVRTEGTMTAHMIHMVGGGLAGTFAATLTYPLDLVKTRLTLQHLSTSKSQRAYNGVLDALTKIARDEGVRGLYKGLSPSLIGFFIYEGGTFMWYEGLKVYLPFLYEHEHGAIVHFASGSLAAAFAQTFSFPLDVIRKRLQFQSNHPGMMEKQYNGAWDCARKIIRKEGFFGLYKGTSANLAKVMPFAALQFAGYEHAKKMMQWYNQWRRESREEAALARFNEAAAAAAAAQSSSSSTSTSAAPAPPSSSTSQVRQHSAALLQPLRTVSAESQRSGPP